jgi:hypothetical protein
VGFEVGAIEHIDHLNLGNDAHAGRRPTGKALECAAYGVLPVLLRVSIAVAECHDNLEHVLSVVVTIL